MLTGIMDGVTATQLAHPASASDLVLWWRLLLWAWHLLSRPA
jgi:hypothetical protein